MAHAITVRCEFVFLEDVTPAGRAISVLQTSNNLRDRL